MISFVYFDVGGVAIRDFSGTNKWAEMKRDLGVKEEFNQEIDQLYDKYEREELSTTRDVDTLIPIFAEKFQLKIPDGYSILADFVNRFEQNTSLWPVIDTICITHRIGLLTNMYPRLLQAIRDQNLLPPVEWDVIIDSTEVKCQKPDKRIYEIAEQRAGTKKDEILFVENNLNNIQAAEQFGWQTFHYDSAHPAESSRKLLRLFLTS